MPGTVQPERGARRLGRAPAGVHRFVLLTLFGSLPAVRDLFDEVEVEVRARVRMLEEGVPTVPAEASPVPATCNDESDDARARQREK